MAISEIIYLLLIITAIVLIPLRIRTRQKTKKQIEEFQVAFNKDLAELTKIIQSRVIDKDRKQVSKQEHSPVTMPELLTLLADIRSMQGVYNEPGSVSFRSIYELLIFSSATVGQWKISKSRSPEDLLSLVVREQATLHRRQEAIWERMDELERIITETTKIYGGPSEIDLRLHMGQS